MNTIHEINLRNCVKILTDCLPEAFSPPLICEQQTINSHSPSGVPKEEGREAKIPLSGERAQVTLNVGETEVGMVNTE